MDRRTILMKGAAMAGLGRPTPSRFPYPDRPESSPGIGAASGQVIRARLVIISGNTVSGVFEYTGTPGPGNPPVAWMTTSSVDPFNNPLPANTIATQNALLGIWSALNNGSAEFGTSTNFAPGTIAPATGVLQLNSPQQTNTDTAASIRLDSAAASPAAALGQPAFEIVTGTFFLADSGGRVIGTLEVDILEITTYTDLTGQTSPPAAPASAARLYANINDTAAAILPSGLTGTLALTQTDTGTYTATTTGFVKMSNVWPVHANDAKNGTVYDLRAWGFGTQGATQQIIECQVNAFGVNGNALTQMAAATIPAGTTFAWWYNAEIEIVTAGAAGSMNIGGKFTWATTGVPVTSANSATAAFSANGVPVNTTVNTNITMQMAWANVLGLPTATSIGNKLIRTGP